MINNYNIDSKILPENTIEKLNEKLLYSTIMELHKYKEIIMWHKKLFPYQPYLDFFGIKKTNEKYVKAELEWYLSESLSVDFIEKYAKLWTQIKDKETGEVNSNYGWCVFSKDNFSQYENCKNKLISKKWTKQASMIYTRPSMWIDKDKGGRKDMMCTHYVHCFIRQEKLRYIVHQRSCDFVFGFFNDFFWHCYVYQRLFNDLKEHYSTLQIDNIDYVCDTYERHYELIYRINEKIKELGVFI